MRNYETEYASSGDMSLLNHNNSRNHTKMEESNCNILLNTIVSNSDPVHRPLSRSSQTARHRRPGVSERPDVMDRYNAPPEQNEAMCDMLSHVKMLNEEIHQRHVAKDADDHYKSEWRMVALILDRILLILFFLMTTFTCVVIFINVPPVGDDLPQAGA